MIVIQKKCDFYDLHNEIWTGATETVNKIIAHQKTEKLMALLEEIFSKPTNIVKINNFLMYCDEYVYYRLGIEED